MKILVLHPMGVGIDQFLDNESLTNLRQLGATGCFGRLTPEAAGAALQEDALGALVTAAGSRAVILNRDADMTLQTLAAEGWDYLRCNIDSLAAEAGLSRVADHRIGQILELLDDETAVLVLLGPTHDSFDGFVLAAPNYPALGELRNVTLPDLAQTLLDMAGYSPATMPGRSLMAGLAPTSADGLSDDEEALLRARLEGLGYIG